MHEQKSCKKYWHAFPLFLTETFFGMLDIFQLFYMFFSFLPAAQRLCLVEVLKQFLLLLLGRLFSFFVCLFDLDARTSENGLFAKVKNYHKFDYSSLFMNNSNLKENHKTLQ